ncbi:hypothetical protein STCU_11913 [Strigomonas culicis]|uniref:Uncharacterized protein n=1 Tax=Strigomonas culicis TaxID=28005 RepID=S9UYI1_9TRYP|nr:hypothetical protein STCU_11913 [Strigomonas culicis]|eukprot:EPY15580.1 hypothetical protein STCU_11913 [Strigomonas culicis]
MVYYGVVPVLVDLLLAGPLLLSNMPRQLMHDMLLQEPLLQKVGYVRDNETIAYGNKSTGPLVSGHYSVSAVMLI